VVCSVSEQNTLLALLLYINLFFYCCSKKRILVTCFCPRSFCNISLQSYTRHPRRQFLSCLLLPNLLFIYSFLLEHAWQWSWSFRFLLDAHNHSLTRPFLFLPGFISREPTHDYHDFTFLLHHRFRYRHQLLSFHYQSWSILLRFAFI
jgi:hypothetical protein